MAFDGIHPTFKQVPPNVPRFSMQAVLKERMRRKRECQHSKWLKLRSLSFLIADSPLDLIEQP